MYLTQKCGIIYAIAERNERVMNTETEIALNATKTLLLQRIEQVAQALLNNTQTLGKVADTSRQLAELVGTLSERVLKLEQRVAVLDYQIKELQNK